MANGMKGNPAYKKEFAPYEYIVTMYDDRGAPIEKKGITFANCYPKAMENIWAYYGNDIEDVKIAALIADPVYEFGDDTGVMFNTAGVEIR